MSTNPTVTFIIVTYQSSKIIDGCIASIRSVGPVEIVVIDNGSTDGSADRCRQLGAKVFSNKSNEGFAAAANRGAQNASDGVVCFINPDCHITKGAVEEAARALQVAPHACAVPFISDPSGRHAGRQAGKQPGYTWRKLVSDVLDTSALYPSLSSRLKGHRHFHDRTWYWPLGTCLFVNRKWFLELGGFDTRYFMYMEDVEFGLALKQAGGEVIQLDSDVLHAFAQGSDVRVSRRMNMLDDARIQFGRRHYGILTAMVLFLISQYRRMGLR